MYGYVYLTENLLTGMCYIGKRAKPKQQISYLGSGTHLNLAIKKYGKDNFVCQPIQWCETKEELCDAERYWISKCNAMDSETFYNIAPGGEGGYALGERNGNFGTHSNHWDEETRRKHSERLTGRKNGPMSDERKRHISEAKKGKPATYHPDHHGKNNPSYGKHWKVVDGHRIYL